MSKSVRLARTFTRLLFPAVLLVLVSVAAGSVYLIYTISRPAKSTYLVRPEKYGQLSTRAAQVTEENWANRDGTSSRGWLLRGTDNTPAVILLHKYGADRSYVLNLGVKMNESTNFTILMPDQRGHGENPQVQNASFGGCETEDLNAAIEFLRNLKNPNGITLVGKDIGIFGVEMGALVAVNAAADDTSIKAVALDSVPGDSNEIVRETVERRYPFVSFATTKLARLGTYMYFFDGCYQRQPACETAKQLQNRDVLLLAGVDAQGYQESTSRMTKCFPSNSRVAGKTDLSPSGFGILNASMEQSEAYDQRLIDFFRASLSE